MKVLIAVYSESGNTEEAARRVASSLGEAGHAVRMEPILAAKPGRPGNNAGAALRQFDAADCDAIILATPVQAFSLPPAMARWLGSLPALGGKRAAFLVTKQLPWNWTGGSRVLGALRKAAEQSGAEPGAGAIVHWASPKRDAEMGAACDAIGRSLGRVG